MTDTGNHDASTIDERLAEYRDLLSQFEAVRARLRRAEEERQSVPRRVYEKVRAEYDRQLDALRGRMTPLRDELDRRRDEFESQLQEANRALSSIEEELAELIFRHRIGEFSDDVLATRRAEVDGRMQAARADIESVRRSLAALGEASPDARAAEEPEAEDPDAAATSRDAASGGAPPAHSSERAPTPAPAAGEEAVPRRPVLRSGASGEPSPRFEKSFVNPHDWIDEFGKDLRRGADAAPEADPAPSAPARPAPEPVKAPPSLVFVSGPHAGQSIPLLQTTLTIGREHDNNIEIKDLEVARYHARILNDRGEYVVEDMASTTGTWVNGVRVQRAALGHGDVIRIGQTEFAIDFEWASNSLERAGIDPAG